MGGWWGIVLYFTACDFFSFKKNLKNWDTGHLDRAVLADPLVERRRAPRGDEPRGHRVRTCVPHVGVPWSHTPCPPTLTHPKHQSPNTHTNTNSYDRLSHAVDIFLDGLVSSSLPTLPAAAPTTTGDDAAAPGAGGEGGAAANAPVVDAGKKGHCVTGRRDHNQLHASILPNPLPNYQTQNKTGLREAAAAAAAALRQSTTPGANNNAPPTTAGAPQGNSTTASGNASSSSTTSSSSSQSLDDALKLLARLQQQQGAPAGAAQGAAAGCFFPQAGQLGREDGASSQRRGARGRNNSVGNAGGLRRAGGPMPAFTRVEANNVVAFIEEVDGEPN